MWDWRGESGMSNWSLAGYEKGTEKKKRLGCSSQAQASTYNTFITAEKDKKTRWQLIVSFLLCYMLYNKDICKLPWKTNEIIFT